MGVTDDLDRLFPNHCSSGRTGDWEGVKRRFPVGQTVTGTVLARSPFGAWVDLGIGFPALLEIIYIADLTPERYRAGGWCPVGSEVTALVGCFCDGPNQIKLSQVPFNRDS